MNQLKEKSFYHTLFVIGVILLPVLEIYRSFFGDSLQIAGFAAEELLLLLWSAVLLLSGLFFAASEKKWKRLWGAVAAILVFLLYALCHGINAAKFNGALLPGSSPSLVREVYYLVRMYFCPLSLILSALTLSLPAPKIRLAAKGAAGIISAGIILPTLLGLAFASYRDGNVLVDGSYFAWLSLPDNAPFEGYTAKGFFSAANDVGAVLFALTAPVACDAAKRGKWYDHLLLFAVGLSSVTVGTKIGAFGFFLAAGAVWVMVLLHRFTAKKKRKGGLSPLFLSLAVILCLIPLLLISPGYRLQNRREAEKETADRPTESVDEIEDISSEFLTEGDALRLKNYLAQHHWDHFIDPWFLELYPVENDPDFWQEVVSRDNHLNSDSRSFKLEMIHRIREKNDRGADLLFGIGFTSGIPYAERDYLNQYYLHGGLGLAVLVAPFFLYLLIGAFFSLKRLVKRENFLPVAIWSLSLFSLLATAYLAGHVFDTLFTTYFLALVSAGLLREATDEDR